MTAVPELLGVLASWKQTTEFPADEDWVFASPSKLGRLPYSYTGFWRELKLMRHADIRTTRLAEMEIVAVLSGKRMAPQVGLERTTLRLTVAASHLVTVCDVLLSCLVTV